MTNIERELIEGPLRCGCQDTYDGLSGHLVGSDCPVNLAPAVAAFIAERERVARKEYEELLDDSLKLADLYEELQRATLKYVIAKEMPK